MVYAEFALSGPATVTFDTDPRYLRARDLVDRGWAAFRLTRPVGQLADARPGVVVIDDPSVNAFVAASDFTGKAAAFSIQVQTGLLALDAPDDGLLGVMMHELQHAIGARGLRRQGQRAPVRDQFANGVTIRNHSVRRTWQRRQTIASARRGSPSCVAAA